MEIPTTITVTVTAEDLRLGMPCTSDACPLARALDRVENVVAVRVSSRKRATLYFQTDERRERAPVPKGRGYRIDDTGRDLILAVDGSKNPNPPKMPTAPVRVTLTAIGVW